MTPHCTQNKTQLPPLQLCPVLIHHPALCPSWVHFLFSHWAFSYFLPFWPQLQSTSQAAFSTMVRTPTSALHIIAHTHTPLGVLQRSTVRLLAIFLLRLLSATGEGKCHNSLPKLMKLGSTHSRQGEDTVQRRKRRTAVITCFRPPTVTRGQFLSPIIRR